MKLVRLIYNLQCYRKLSTPVWDVTVLHASLISRSSKGNPGFWPNPVPGSEGYWSKDRKWGRPTKIKRNRKERGMRPWAGGEQSDFSTRQSASSVQEHSYQISTAATFTQTIRNKCPSTTIILCVNTVRSGIYKAPVLFPLIAYFVKAAVFWRPAMSASNYKTFYRSWTLKEESVCPALTFFPTTGLE